MIKMKETYSVDADSVLDHIVHLTLDSIAVGFPVSHLHNLFIILKVKIDNALYSDAYNTYQLTKKG